jgi:TetR/AcrR family transcriptional repressor of nem operon
MFVLIGTDMKKHSKQHVIEVGESLFRVNGYHNTGTEDVMREADYPRSSFYYHFKSKEGFAQEVLMHYGEKLSAFYADILRNTSIGNAYERLLYLFDSLVQNAENSKFTSESLIQKMAIECAGYNEGIRKAANDQLIRIVSVLAECITEGWKDKSIQSNLSARDLALCLQSQYYGAYSVGRLQMNAQAMKRMMVALLSKYKA